MIVVGLTGGIASGKTTISFFLKEKRFSVHDSDFVVKKIYSNPTSSFLKYLKGINLSNSIKGKKINKKIIREEVFYKKEKRRKLEKFIHNEVRKSRNQFLNEHKRKKTKIVFLDIPLLFEAKLQNICDYIILLYLPRKNKIQRALVRKGMTKNLLLKIIKSQKSDTYKKKRADFIINTSKSKKHSFKMILNAIDNIMDAECAR